MRGAYTRLSYSTLFFLPVATSRRRLFREKMLNKHGWFGGDRGGSRDDERKEKTTRYSSDLVECEGDFAFLSILTQQKVFPVIFFCAKRKHGKSSFWRRLSDLYKLCFSLQNGAPAGAIPSFPVKQCIIMPRKNNTVTTTTSELTTNICIGTGERSLDTQDELTVSVAYKTLSFNVNPTSERYLYT